MKNPLNIFYNYDIIIIWGDDSVNINFCQKASRSNEFAWKKQSDLSNDLNIPKSAISQYLSGKFEAKQDRIYDLAKYLDVNEPWLMGYDVPMERAKNNAEQIYYDFTKINEVLSDFPITDTNVLDTQVISKAINKTMEINKAILSTPRIYVNTITIEDAVIGLKFLLAYYKVNFFGCEDDEISKLIDSPLFENFVKNIFHKEINDIE